MSAGASSGRTRIAHTELAVGLAAAALFVYLVVRAATLSFTHDESFTYTRLVGRSVEMLLTYDYASANHHLVNTLLMKGLDATLGASELALRAGSLAAAAVFLGAIFVWAVDLQAPILRALGFVFAGASPLVLDFLVLARGYALALAGVATAAAIAVRYGREPTLARAGASAAAGGVAAVAQFAFLPFFVALCGALCVYALLWRRRVRTTLLALAGVAAVVAAVVAVPVTQLRRAGELYFGTNSPRETYASLVEGSLYGEWSSGIVDAAELILLALLSMALAATVRSAIRSQPPPASSMLGLLVLLPAAIVVAQHVLFDTPYPLGRTALYLVPLAAMWICTTADELHASGTVAWRRGVTVGAAALLVLVPLNLAASLNLSRTYEWEYDADTEEIADDLAGATAGEPGARVGASWLLEPTLNFYRLSKNLPFSEITDDCRGDCLLESYDWYAGVDDDRGLQNGETGGVTVERYPTSGGFLVRTDSQAAAS